MSESKIQTAIGMCVVSLTKYLMSEFSLSQDEAFSKLSRTRLYEILNDVESGLFLEQNEYLFKALDTELEKGKSELENYFY